MAQSLLGKIKILIGASLHGLVDRALESNSVAVFDQYIRDAEQSMTLLKSAITDLAATTKMLRRKYDEAADEAARYDLQVDAALKAGKDTLAKVTQSKLNQQLEIAKTYKEQYEKEQSTFGTLTDVVQVLQAKVDVLHTQRDQVATLLQLVKSKNLIARSIKDVQQISDDKTKRIVEDVKTQLDTADARLEVASSRLSTQIDDAVADSQLENQLESRRQRLGLS
jgi:phage shock protein A